MTTKRKREAYVNDEDRRVLIAIRLPRSLVEKLRQQTGSIGRLIEKALVEYYKVEVKS